MNISREAVLEAASVGLLCWLLFWIQGGYNAFEFIRHALVDGLTDHAYGHLWHASPLLIVLILCPSINKWAWQKIWKLFNTPST